MKTLEAAKVAEAFTKVLNEVHSLRESFEIVKRGVPYAYLVPAAERGCNSHELAEDLATYNLPSDERNALASAVRKGRRALKPLRNPWV